MGPADQVSSKGCTAGTLADDRLFLRRWIYDRGLIFEESVADWWLGETETSREIWKALLARPDLDDAHRASIEGNLNLPH